MLSDDLRKILSDDGRTMYAIHKVSGVSQDVLGRFMKGGGLTIESADKIGKALELQITLAPARRATTKR